MTDKPGNLGTALAEHREETPEENEVALFHATVEAAYALGFTPAEVSKHIDSDPELRAVKKSISKCRYEVGSEISGEDYFSLL